MPPDDAVWTGGLPGAPLAGVRVVDLGQYLAGPLLATLLADQGADVIRIERPDGPAWSGPADAVLHRNRRRIRLDLHSPQDRNRADALVATADVLVENFRPGRLDAVGLGPDVALARNPRLVYCSLPGFGRTDARAADPGWEGAVMAAAGAYGADAVASIIPTAEDVVVARPSHLPLASVFAALDGALAVVSALHARARDGVGQWVEVPLFDALFEAIGLRALALERGRPFYNDFGSGFYHCADGRYVSFVVAFHRHLEWFLTAADAVEEIGDLASYDRLCTDPAVLPVLRQRLVEVFARRPAEQWEQQAIAHGFPLGMLRSAGEWLNSDHARESGTVVDVDVQAGRVRVPAPAVVLHDYRQVTLDGGAKDDPRLLAALDAHDPPASVAGAAPDVGVARPPLAGVRVIEQSRIVAAPTAAKLLAQLGAEVIKIEQDPATFRASFPMPFAHVHLDRGKQTVVLDLHDPTDRSVLDDLLGTADVYVQNLTLGADTRLGLDAPTLCGRLPTLIYLYLNANGRHGPWAPGRGYADVANIVTGVCEPTVRDEAPESGAWGALHAPPWTYTDYAAGVLGAFGVVVALLARARTGHGTLVETSLLRAATLQQVLETGRTVGASGLVDPGQSVSSPVAEGHALQRLYRTADGAVFVGARRAQAAAIAAAFGLADVRDLGTGLAAAFRATSSASAVRRLGDAGVAAQPVVSVEEVMVAGGDADRRGLRLVDRTAAHGEVIMPGPVISFSRTPMVAGAAPGEFGCDGERVRHEVDRGARTLD